MDLDGRELVVHVANSGRLEKLLASENPMWLAPASATGRKTAYDLALVDVGGALVSADARLPNAPVREAIQLHRLPEFEGYEDVKTEVTLGESRINLQLSGRPGTCYVEVKSVTLVEDGKSLFPDAPTTRGRKHVLSLQEAVRDGHRAAVVFVIQRDDAESMSPNWPADPEFCRTLALAAEEGVEVHAYRCELAMTHVELSEPVPVDLSEPLCLSEPL